MCNRGLGGYRVLCVLGGEAIQLFDKTKSDYFHVSFRSGKQKDRFFPAFSSYHSVHFFMYSLTAIPISLLTDIS